jgi:predicted DNA-binding transcriptional regulator AlpA
MTKTFTIDDVCTEHGISRQLFYKMQREGRGPKTFKIGRSVRISEHAANEWIATLEAAAA